MIKVCKQYMADVKALFPIIGKEERKYIKGLTTTVNEFCENEYVTSKEVLYRNFGIPTDIVNTYYTGRDMEQLLKRIRVAKYAKITMWGLLIIMLLAIIAYYIIYVVDVYHIYRVFDEQDAIFEDFRKGKRTMYVD